VEEYCQEKTEEFGENSVPELLRSHNFPVSNLCGEMLASKH